MENIGQIFERSTTLSHFTVLVIGDNPEELLAPYDKNLEVEPYREDIPQKDIDSMVTYFTIEAKEEKRIEGLDANDLTTLQPHWLTWSGCKLLIDEDGKPYRMSEYNPKSEWDWYQVGGRWQGMLRLKHGKKGKQGKASLLMKDHKYRAEYADKAKMAAIDWEYMRHDPETLWHLKLQWEKAARGDDTFYKPEYLTKKYGTEKEYLRRNLTFSTFAVVTADGKWHEKGDMGYWGMSSETVDEDRVWLDNYWEAFLKELAPDTTVTIYDCHI